MTTEQLRKKLIRAGVSGVNKPKRTPKHPKKSHIVVAKEGDKVKTIRFGQQGAKTAGKPKLENLNVCEKSVNLLRQDTEKILTKEKCLLLTGPIRLSGRT